MKRILFAALLCATATSAIAQQFCVGDSTDLQSRIFQAHGIAVANPQAQVEIRIRRSATPYVLTTLPDTLLGMPYASLSLRGGYDPDPNDDCTTQGRITNASNTVLEFDPDADTFFTIQGDFLAQGVTLDTPNGIRVSHRGNAPSDVTIESSIVKDACFHALTVDSSQQSDAPLSIRIVNNVFTGTIGAEGCALSIGFHPSDDTAEIANNTVTNNEGAAICYQDMASVRLDNNVVWGNGSGVEDWSDAQTKLTLLHNLLQTPNDIPGLVGGHPGGLSIDPQFAAGSFALQANSPGVNSGNDGVPGGLPLLDINGNQRKVGSHVDRGAYEWQQSDTDVIVVNTAQDTLDNSNGKMSLRSALILANTEPGTETIEFAIGTTPFFDCEAKIVLDPQLGELPEITESLIIDGYSQGPATPNTLAIGFDANICIALIGNGDFDGGLFVPSNSNANVVVRGIRFAGFFNAVWLNGGTSHLVEGNSFDPGTDEPNGTNVFIGGSGAFVGGLEPAQRNLLSGALQSIHISTGIGTYVVGNWIGPRIDGISDPESRNSLGIFVYDSDNCVIERNFIAGNTVAGIEIVDGTNTLVTGNTISTNASGIVIAGAADGATKATVASNEISYNTDAGIAVQDGTFENLLVGNSIHHNGGQGIDLSDDGQVNPNDADVGFASTEGNRGLNFPVLAQAKTLDGESPSTAQALGVLNSANGTFKVRFYANDECDESGHGEGQEPVGSTTIQITNAGQFNNGSKGFSAPVESLTSLGGRYITATATDASGNTSEFGACTSVDIGELFRDGFEGP